VLEYLPVLLTMGFTCAAAFLVPAIIVLQPPELLVPFLGERMVAIPSPYLTRLQETK
jgi:hypothetical protein